MCLWTGSRNLSATKASAGVFWPSSSNPIGSAGRFSGGLPLAHASTKPWRPLSVRSRKGFFYFCTFLHSEAQRHKDRPNPIKLAAMPIRKARNIGIQPNRGNGVFAAHAAESGVPPSAPHCEIANASG